MGGSGPVIWSYFAEFQPKSRRGSMLSFMAAFWTLGNLFVAGLAWLVIPSGSFTVESLFKWIPNPNIIQKQESDSQHHISNTIHGGYSYYSVHRHHF